MTCWGRNLAEHKSNRPVQLSGGGWCDPRAGCKRVSTVEGRGGDQRNAEGRGVPRLLRERSV